MADAFNVDPARSNIGRHEDFTRTALERLQRLVTLRLGFIPVNGVGFELLGQELADNLVGAVLGARKHQRPVNLRIQQKLAQELQLIPIGNMQNTMPDPFSRRALRRHRNLHRIL